MNSKFLILFGLIVAIVTSIFVFQNTQVVELNFIRWTIEMPVILLMLFSFGIGFLLALVLAIPGQLKSGWNSWGLRSKVRGLEKKVGKVEQAKEKIETELKEVKDNEVVKG